MWGRFVLNRYPLVMSSESVGYLYLVFLEDRRYIYYLGGTMTSNIKTFETGTGWGSLDNGYFKLVQFEFWMLCVLSTIHWPFTLTLPFSNSLQSNASPKYFNPQPQPHDCSNINDTQSSFQYWYEWLCISISIPNLPGLGCLILLIAHTNTAM